AKLANRRHSKECSRKLRGVALRRCKHAGYTWVFQWAASSVGRAPRSQRGGREFEPPAVHQHSSEKRGSFGCLFSLYSIVRGFLWPVCGEESNVSALRASARRLDANNDRASVSTSARILPSQCGRRDRVRSCVTVRYGAA